MIATLNQHILSILVFLPLILALIIGTIRTERYARTVAIFGTGLVFLLCLHLWYYFDGSSSGLQFVEHYKWIESTGIQYILGVDGISLLLVVLSGFLPLLIAISLWPNKANNTRFYLANLLALESGMMGSLLSLDMVLFYVFWEVMLIPMYFIIGLWGGPRKIYATTKFIIYTVAGSLLMLVAAISLYYMHYQEFGFYSTSLEDLYKVSVQGTTQNLLFLAFALAFAIKVPLWPFHTWLPDAHVEAPTGGSVVLAGVLLKMGTYGLLRFAIPLFPEAVELFAAPIIALSVIGIIYGALVAWIQEDAKKLVAYSSVSHLGFVVLGCLALSSDGISVEALTGAVFQMISHGISTGALFFLVGAIYERRHTRMLSDFGGLAGVMPWYATFFIIATMASVGLPGTGGFIGEFLILVGSFKSWPFATIVASTGVVLGAVYMLTLARKILFGPVKHEENANLKDLSFIELCYIVPLAVIAILMGVFPELFLSKVRPSIENLANSYKHYRLSYIESLSDQPDLFLSSKQAPL